MEYHEGKVLIDFGHMKKIVKRSGLKSKSSRKIQKRFKLIINAALREFLDEQENRESV